MKTILLISFLVILSSSLWAQSSTNQAERYKALSYKVDTLQSELNQWTQNLSAFLQNDSLSDSAYYQLEKQTSQLNVTIREIT